MVNIQDEAFDTYVKSPVKTDWPNLATVAAIVFAVVFAAVYFL